MPLVSRTIIFFGVARAFFVTHAMLCIWRVVEVTGEDLFWLLTLLCILLSIEAIATLLLAMKKFEWQVFSPCILIYITTVIICTWILEFNLYFQRLDYAEKHNIDCGTTDVMYRNTSIPLGYIPISPIYLDDQEWSLALQQVFLFILVIGRWLLPQGGITRDQLYELLLVNIGMAADILEFIIEGININVVGCSSGLITMILFFWSFSLMQFTLSLTAEREKVALAYDTTDVGILSRWTKCPHCVCCSTDVWATMVTLIMQDGPFVIVRLYLIIEFDAISQGMLFFTAKNLLVIVVQIYRLIFLYNKSETENELSKAKQDLSDRDPESDNAKQQPNKSEINVAARVTDDSMKINELGSVNKNFSYKI
ncbi:transmembrane protein 26-like [Anneissia japonica]|uniref:transmembrane protein 26-like n=1 Tax=Anneissia japonica TaxID=1529436 RepID=UPI001425A4F9|nr:transmembrane protein 26-like [Anneissia japonica]